MDEVKLFGNQKNGKPSREYRKTATLPDGFTMFNFLLPSVVSVDALPHTGYNLPALLSLRDNARIINSSYHLFN